MHPPTTLLHRFALAVWMVAPLHAGSAWAQTAPSTCRVPVFRGAVLPAGADAEMHVVNTGQPCTIANWGMFTERQNPAFAGEITRAPANGTAEFKPPRAMYTPNPGFAGEDYFEYQANAKGPSENALLFRVRVKVFVLAP
jgi:Bacterial Ig domain